MLTPSFDETMEGFRARYEAGDWRALTAVIGFLPLPPLLRRALHECIQAKHATPAVRRKEMHLAADYERARKVWELRKTGMTWEKACEKVASDLRVSVPTIHAAYVKHRRHWEFMDRVILPTQNDNMRS